MIENSSMYEEDSWRRPDEGWFVRDNFAANRRVNMLQKLLRNGILSLKGGYEYAEYKTNI